MTDDDFINAIARVREELVQECPEIDNLLAAELPPFDTLKALWNLLATEPELKKRTEHLFLGAFGLENQSLAHLPDRERMLEKWGFTNEDLLYQPFEDRPEYALHPLFMGLIVELLQFDGDIPELRTGKMPEGGFPAVPVRTSTRDPLAIGAMLMQARYEVEQELQSALEAKQKKLKAAKEVLGDEIVRVQEDLPVSVPGYAPGHRAEPREVQVPSSLTLRELEFSVQQKITFDVLKTTQGRRSVSPIIADIVLEAIHQAGYSGVTSGDANEEGPVFAEAQWVTDVSGGAAEYNPRFSFIDVAARTISRQLREQLDHRATRYVRLRMRVSPINRIADREVGWKAVMFGAPLA